MGVGQSISDFLFPFLSTFSAAMSPDERVWANVKGTLFNPFQKGFFSFRMSSG